MNLKELQIIELLRKDARISLAEISRNIGMPISTIHDKIRRFEKKGTIKGYSAQVDFNQLGFNHRARIAVRVSRLLKNNLLIFLQKSSSVYSISEINGGFDFMVETAHPDIKEYLGFIDKLKEDFSLEAVQEFQVIGEVRKEERE